MPTSNPVAPQRSSDKIRIINSNSRILFCDNVPILFKSCKRHFITCTAAIKCAQSHNRRGNGSNRFYMQIRTAVYRIPIALSRLASSLITAVWARDVLLVL